MLSGIQHFIFCRRQWALIHIEQQWQENLYTIQGLLFHEKAHSEQTQRRGNKLITRGMRVQSHALKITGVCDVVEFIEDHNGIALFGEKKKYSVFPIEYKKGKPKSHNADKLQLCAQAMCLEEMLVTTIEKGCLFYGETKRREEVFLSKELRAEVTEKFQEMHGYFSRGYTPKVKPSSKCKKCSLQNVCLPSLGKTQLVKEYMKQALSETAGD